MLKSVNQWCFPPGTPLEEVLRGTRDAGFDAIELNVNPSEGVGLTMDTTAQEAEAIGKMVRDHGLQLHSLSTALLWQVPLSSDDASVREQGQQVVTKQLELANLLGADTVLVVPGVVNEESAYDVCYRNSQEALRKLVPEAEKQQVSIGIENVWNKFLLSPLEMARYVDELESKYVGVYFDVGNILQVGFPEQWIRILGSRIKKIHVKDFDTRVGNISGFVPLLAGDVDWIAVRNALNEIGYTDTITAELSPYKSAPLQLIYDTARHMDVMIHGDVK